MLFRSRQAESAVRECGITLNRNAIPYDPNGAWYTSGLRLGTPATTTLGMGVADMQEIASIMTLILKNTSAAPAPSGGKSKAKYTVDPAARNEASARAAALLARYPVYPELDLAMVEQFLASLTVAAAAV